MSNCITQTQTAPEGACEFHGRSFRLQRAARWFKTLLTAALLVFFIIPSIASPTIPEVVAQAHQGNGYIGHSYLAAGVENTTGDKAESKLWWNDCTWWASMFNEPTRAYHIYRLNQDEQVWQDTGTEIDERNESRADVLWDEDEQKLYVLSHDFAPSPRPARNDEEGRLYRYSYDAQGDRYSLDSGFPVNVMSVVPRVLTITKDSTGWLWIAYVWNQSVLVQYSSDDGRDWSEPYSIRGDGTAVQTNDITGIIAFDSKIGVAWTNQRSGAIYFAVHNDGESVENWTEEVIIDGSRVADDHLNLAADSHGRVYLATKTSNSRGADPFILIHVRQTDGSWATHVFGYQRDDHTRAAILIDESNQMLYVFATAPQSGGSIYYKSTPLDNISFEEGRGTLIMHFPDALLNNVTSTKQPVSSATGLVILASARNTRRYYHNSLSLEEGANPTALADSFCSTDDAPQAVASYYVSSPTNINVRTEPTTRAPVFMSLQPGTPVVVIGEVAGDFVEGSNLWAEVDIEGQTVYIHSHLLTQLP